MTRAKTMVTVALVSALSALLACAAPQANASRTHGAPRTNGTSGVNSAARQAPADTSVATRRCIELLPLMELVSGETGLSLPLLVGIVRVESNFRNDVRSPVGAIGLTQCMPATARAKHCGPLDDAYENLKCGASVMLGFLKYYDNSLYLGLSGYNAGHGMPGRARRTGELPANIEYVEKVLQAATRFETRGCDF